MGLLDDSDSSSDEENQNVDLKVNKKFAGKFERQERFKELQRSKELLESGEISDSDSESETEDEDAEQLSSAMDLKIIQTINSIRKKDPKIYRKDTTWFEKPAESSEGSEDEGVVAKKDTKKKYKDVLRDQLLTHGADIEGKDAKSSSKRVKENTSNNLLSYDQEQEKIRQDFLKSAGETEKKTKDKKKVPLKASAKESSDSSNGENESSEDDLLLKVKPKTSAELAREEQELKKALEEMKELGQKASKSTSTIQNNASENDIDPEEFLTNYMVTKKWKDNNVKYAKTRHDSSGSETDADQEYSYEEEEAELEKLDRFESKYNFRFEELQDEQEEREAGVRGVRFNTRGGVTDLQVAGHARNVEGSMRRVDDKRKQARELRAERKEKEKRQKEAELRRLKNLKRQELKDRLARIGEIGGIKQLLGLDESLLDDDWDPAKHEAMMASQFDDNYYNAHDEQFTYNEDQYDQDHTNQELLGYDDGDAGAAAQEYDNEEEGYEEEYYGEENENVEIGDEDRAEVTHMVDELYKLDYEDIVAGMPCRFKYKEVEPQGFGLTSEDILLADDSELNKFVSLKHISAYNNRGYDKSEAEISKKRKKLRTTLKERLAREAEEAAAAGKEIPGLKKKSKKGAVSAQDTTDVDVEVQAPANEDNMGEEQEQGGDEEGGKKKRRRRKRKEGEDSNNNEVVAVSAEDKQQMSGGDKSSAKSTAAKKITAAAAVEPVQAVTAEAPLAKKAKHTTTSATTATASAITSAADNNTSNKTATTSTATDTNKPAVTTPAVDKFGNIKVGTNKERKLKVLEEKKKHRKKLIEQQKLKQTSVKKTENVTSTSNSTISVAVKVNGSDKKAPENIKKRLDLYQ